MCNCSKTALHAAPPSDTQEFESFMAEMLSGGMQQETGKKSVGLKPVFEPLNRGIADTLTIEVDRAARIRLNTVVFFPEAFDPKKPVDLLLYFHGLLEFPGRRTGMVQYLQTRGTDDNHDIRLMAEVNASGKNVLLVAPLLGPNTDQELLAGKRFDTFMTGLMTALETLLAANFPVKRMKRGRLILAGHSAGGKVLRRVGLQHSFDEMWGFDCMYGHGPEWLQLAKKNPQASIFLYYNRDAYPSKDAAFGYLRGAVEKDQKKAMPVLRNLVLFDVRKDPARNATMNAHFKMLRPAMRERLAALADVNATTDWEEESEDAPSAAPAMFKGVPFAPLPPAGSYWPLVTDHPQGKTVSYIGQDKKLTGSSERHFGSGRSSSGGRHHAGIDLFANFRDPVIAIDEGVILAHYPFCCGEHKTTWSLLVRHSNVVVNYGEVEKELPGGIGVGCTVHAGQTIAHIGRNPRGGSMLHFEVYRADATRNIRWYRSAKTAPEKLYDPTPYLLYLRDYGKIQNATMAVDPNDCPPKKTRSSSRKKPTKKQHETWLGELLEEVLQEAPDAAFSLRKTMAELALAEHKRWGEGTKAGADKQFHDILKNYYLEGAKADMSGPITPKRAERIVNQIESTKKGVKRPAWSAAFISWIVQQAVNLSGRSIPFRYGTAHVWYVSKAKQAQRKNDPSYPFWAYRVEDVKPEIGDLICNSRSGEHGLATYDNVDNGKGWTLHCDVVMAVSDKEITVVGGNAVNTGGPSLPGNTVGKKIIRLDKDGHVPPVGEKNKHYIAVIKYTGDKQ